MTQAAFGIHGAVAAAFVAGLGFLAAPAPAEAMAVVAASASAPPPGLGRPPQGARAARVEATHDLVAGTVTSVDVVKKTLVVSGVALTWTSNRLHVFARGARASEYELRPGQKIRFAVEPGVAESRRVVLVYVEGA